MGCAIVAEFDDINRIEERSNMMVQRLDNKKWCNMNFYNVRTHSKQGTS